MPKCGEVYDSSDEYDRDDRIETYYQGWSARAMAERLVELEDEIGSNVDGICTGMHADVAEAHAEIERLTAQVESFNGWRGSIYEVARGSFRSAGRARRSAQRYRLAWLSARRRAKTAKGAWRAAQHIAESWHRMFRRESDLTRELLSRAGQRVHERDRYRLAWLSARRRAADEANMGMEALELKRDELRRVNDAFTRLTATLADRSAEVYRLRAELRESTRAPRLEYAGEDEDGEMFRLA
jgi:prophage DNA circulation protein